MVGDSMATFWNQMRSVALSFPYEHLKRYLGHNSDNAGFGSHVFMLFLAH